MDQQAYNQKRSAVTVPVIDQTSNSRSQHFLAQVRVANRKTWHPGQQLGFGLTDSWQKSLPWSCHVGNAFYDHPHPARQ